MRVPRLTCCVLVAFTVATALSATPLSTTPPSTTPTTTGPPADDGARVAAAASAADTAARTGWGDVRLGEGETLERTEFTEGGTGLFYASYQRRYRGLPVIHGDVMIIVDGVGLVKGATTVPGASGFRGDTTPRVDRDRAVAVARAELTRVDGVDGTRLVVLAGSHRRLAHQVDLRGGARPGPGRAHVFVDALDGRVLEVWGRPAPGGGAG